MRVEKILNKNLSPYQKSLINKARIKEWGRGEKKSFKKDFEPNTKWFFIKEKSKVVALGGLRPIELIYKNKSYNILGICSMIALEKGKGYGKILTQEMIKYSKKMGKTILGFTKKAKIFEKCGLKTKKDFIKRFVWMNKNGEKVLDDDGDGIYYEGKDKFVSKVLKNKGMVEIPVEFW